MKNKFFLAAILLTPILVVVFSSMYFSFGMSPDGTKNNGVFFENYFEFNQFKNEEEKRDLVEFEDGKWVLSVYITDLDLSKESIYLMRQLNVALNRDINKLKRIVFYSDNTLDLKMIDLKNKYPRIEIIKDTNGALLDVLQENSKINFNVENPIFVIDPYGRAVMYFEPETDPKLMLKDLKVLI
tara:strand:+ start:1915 stop:2466 length:552 start_codon:yes stop_codon:yes gene_type:complete